MNETVMSLARHQANLDMTEKVYAGEILGEEA